MRSGVPPGLTARGGKPSLLSASAPGAPRPKAVASLVCLTSGGRGQGGRVRSGFAPCREATWAVPSAVSLNVVQNHSMETDERVLQRYELTDEDGRLWEPGKGDLVRLRTWDIFERYLPPSGRVLDVGGGPGAHAAHLAEKGFDVYLLDPVQKHLQAARRRAASTEQWTFEVAPGDARELPMPDSSFDVVLLLGPLYHLVDASDRQKALAEAQRVLRPGGTLLAEIICRDAWVLDATLRDRLSEPDIWDVFTRNIDTGLSHDPGTLSEGGFWAYFHRPEELRSELSGAAFADIELVAVEGFGWLLGDLERRIQEPGPFLRAIRLTENEVSMLGCSAHVIGAAARP
jgi:ubiquinone/menaquinone biosynthesis C-methylase UbiE